MWWQKTNEKLSYVSYKVNQTEVMVGPRLDSRGCSLEFFNSVSAWLVVTESYIEFPVTANVRWFPWKELLEPLPDHALYGSLKMLNYWINELKLPKVYIHCDLGSHRAPSIFGAFLYAYYPEQQAKIIKQRQVIKPEHSPVIGSDGTIHGDPHHYFKTYLDEVSLMKTMVEMIIKYPKAPLDAIVRITFENRPLNLYTEAELAEYNSEQKEKELNRQRQLWLKSIGFEFTAPEHQNSIADAQTPQGLSHIIGDRFFPDMLNSLKKYKRLYLTSEAGLDILKSKISGVEVKDTLRHEAFTLFYIELDLDTLKEI